MNSVVASLTAYAAAASLLTVTPGLDTALVLRMATTENSRRAAWAAIGIVSGCFVWAALVALGLGALLATSQFAYTALRWIGAAYLLWFGYKLLRHPRRAYVAPVPSGQPQNAAFVTGTLTNLLNPKVGVFYVSFLPQFVPQNVSVAPYILLLGAIHALLGLVWFGCLIAATRPISAFLHRPAVVRSCDRLTGGIFVAFGLGLALESRRS
jgi:threonine/homoserine/homoserine lactone efflux protein